MDLSGCSEGDKHVLYGVLLRKSRSHAQERKVLAIIRGSAELEARIEALLALQEEEDRLLASPAARGGLVGASTTRSAGKHEGSALVVDVRPDVTKLLRKCALKRRLTFHRLGESYDVVHQLRRLQARLIVLNDTLPAEEYTRYFEICRAIEPKIRLICLCASPPGVNGSEAFNKFVRFLPKPISMEKLEAAAEELLAARG